MLPEKTIPSSLSALLLVCRSCFTGPTFRSFCALLAGMIAQTRRRMVCGMLLGAGLERLWHHTRAHRLFSSARWSADEVGLALAGLIAECLLPAGAALVVAVDDTLFKRSAPGARLSVRPGSTTAPPRGPGRPGSGTAGSWPAWWSRSRS